MKTRANKDSKKQPDEFVTLMDRIVRYVMERRGASIALALVLVGLLGGVAFLQYWQAKQAAAWASQIEAALAKGDQAALDQWQSLLDKSPPGDLEALIYLKKGTLLGKQDKWLEAAQAFEQGQASAPNYLEALLQQSQLVALENASKQEAALALAKNLAQDAQHPYREEAVLSQARLLKSQGKNQEVKNLLLPFSKDEKTSEQAKQEALNFLLLLDS